MTHCVLTIAGSDSGGNAGIQADLRMFHDYRLHGCTVFTSLTAQNPNEVHAIHDVPADFVAAQLHSVIDVYSIRALKTGMLFSAPIIQTVVDTIKDWPLIAKVIDPVMVATSGARLLKPDAISVIKSELLPLADLVTPNIPEAELLANAPITDRASLRDAAKRIFDEFGCSVLVKGGHALGDLALGEDTLYDGTEFRSFILPPIPHPVSTHGTGCSLSAALAAELALERNLNDAVTGAKKAVHDAIKNSYLVGPECGVLGFTNH
ncbi:MAG: bifunctional hydroxymethylpyrimidine kinase/phosphomethylpyrimidine kinase [Kiritimatiellae bacterium]|nr:bifunctional hydroxymethylpyrimidine kinase/phosphomethylpyrimidine kinase [Kiritimatiellia bacterium]